VSDGSEDEMNFLVVIRVIALVIGIVAIIDAKASDDVGLMLFGCACLGAYNLSVHYDGRTR
jgi:hypothetical protein